MRYLITVAVALSLVVLYGCGSEDTVKILRNDPGDGIPDAIEYFHLDSCDIWYYTYTNESGESWEIVREVAPDITIEGTPAGDCIGITENGGFFECWSLDTFSFEQHFLGVRISPQVTEVLSVEPALEIPFNLRSDRPHYYSSVATDIRNQLITFDIEGFLIFDGYSTHTVTAGTFVNCMTLLYTPVDANGKPDIDSPDAYREYYAPGVGLIDNGDIVLDSAYVNGIRYPR